MRTHSEGNANHKPITTNHKPVNKGRFTPPSITEIQDYCLQRGNQIDPERFFDHYSANGWMRGKNKIKDWKACVRTWEKTQTQLTGKQSTRDRPLIDDLTDTGWAD